MSSGLFYPTERATLPKGYTSKKIHHSEDPISEFFRIIIVRLFFFSRFIAWIHIKSSCQGELPALPLKFEPGTDCKTIPSSVRPFNSLYCRFVNTSRLRLEFWRCRISCGKGIGANFGAVLVCDVLHDLVFFDWSWTARTVYLILWAWKHPFSWRQTSKKEQSTWLTVTQMALCIPGIIKRRSSNKIPPKVCKIKSLYECWSVLGWVI